MAIYYDEEGKPFTKGAPRVRIEWVARDKTEGGAFDWEPSEKRKILERWCTMLNFDHPGRIYVVRDEQP